MNWWKKVRESSMLCLHKHQSVSGDMVGETTLLETLACHPGSCTRDWAQRLRNKDTMAASSLAAPCELLWALQLILYGEIKSRIKRKPKFTEPKAADGILVCACLPGVQRVSSSGLQNSLDRGSVAEQMHSCRRNSEGFHAGGDG